MAKQTRNILKELFQTGKKPTGGNYVDLLDSYLLINGENTGSIDIQGSITASGDISASGIIYADTFQSHGGTEIGISDNLNVTGGITASNISSSGFISASVFLGDGSGLTNITASSLSIQQITASYLSGSIQTTGSLTYTSGSTNVLYGIQSSGSIIPDSSSAWDLGGPNNKFKDLFLSGNISSSGTVTANTFAGNLTGNVTGQAATVATIAGLAPNTATTQATQGNITSLGTLTGLNVNGHITASDIKSNGNLKVDNSASFGHISASGDLKVDGFASFGGFGNIQSMSSTTSVPANTNMILYGPITIVPSGILNIAVSSQVLVKDFINA